MHVGPTSPAAQAAYSRSQNGGAVGSNASPPAVQQTYSGSNSKSASNASVTSISSSSQPLRKLLLLDRFDLGSEPAMLQTTVRDSGCTTNTGNPQQPLWGPSAALAKVEQTEDLHQPRQRFAWQAGGGQRELQQLQGSTQEGPGQADLNQAETITQYPSAVYDWGNTRIASTGSGPSRQQQAALDVALWLNNTNLQVRWLEDVSVPGRSDSVSDCNWEVS
jgi:hypothetical protein